MSSPTASVVRAARFDGSDTSKHLDYAEEDEDLVGMDGVFAEVTKKCLDAPKASDSQSSVESTLTVFST